MLSIYKASSRCVLRQGPIKPRLSPNIPCVAEDDCELLVLLPYLLCGKITGCTTKPGSRDAGDPDESTLPTESYNSQPSKSRPLDCTAAEQDRNCHPDSQVREQRLGKLQVALIIKESVSGMKSEPHSPPAKLFQRAFIKLPLCSNNYAIWPFAVYILAVDCFAYICQLQVPLEVHLFEIVLKKKTTQICST